MNKILVRKIVTLGVIIVFCSLALTPVIGAPAPSVIDLPMPITVDMGLEGAMSRRMSIRNFTEDPVPLEELSTVLWAAYGYREDKNRTVYGMEGLHAAELYVFTNDSVFWYDAYNHSLILYKSGDYRSMIAQYEAPIQLGIVWNSSKNSDENLSGAEIGMIGQNIQFVANALGLGTVVTASRPSPLDDVGLPPGEYGRIVMPLGTPLYPYMFEYKPRWVSLLPQVLCSHRNVTDVLMNFSVSTSFGGCLSWQEFSQIVWSLYGYSPLLDRSDQEGNPLKRHRTVPSAHGYYPFRVYAVMAGGVYRYIPGLLPYDKFGLPIVSYLQKIRWLDHRDEVADASQPFVSSAPLILVIVLDIRNTNKWDDLSGEAIRWVWFYEAGAMAHNVVLAAEAWDLNANIVPVTDPGSLCDLLLLRETNYQPMLIVPLGG